MSNGSAAGAPAASSSLIAKKADLYGLLTISPFIADWTSDHPCLLFRAWDCCRQAAQRGRAHPAQAAVRRRRTEAWVDVTILAPRPIGPTWIGKRRMNPTCIVRVVAPRVGRPVGPTHVFGGPSPRVALGRLRRRRCTLGSFRAAPFGARRWTSRARADLPTPCHATATHTPRPGTETECTPLAQMADFINSSEWPRCACGSVQSHNCAEDRISSAPRFRERCSSRNAT